MRDKIVKDVEWHQRKLDETETRLKAIEVVANEAGWPRTEALEIEAKAADKWYEYHVANLAIAKAMLVLLPKDALDELIEREPTDLTPKTKRS